MREVKVGRNWIFQSKDFYDLDQNLEEHVDKIIKGFLRRRLFQEVVMAYKAFTRLNGFIILDAHGEEKPWKFYDGKRRYSVQNWLNKIDGEGLAVLLLTCNPRFCEISSEMSLVFHVDGDVHEDTLNNGVPKRLFMPGRGYIEDSYYRIHQAIEQLWWGNY